MLILKSSWRKDYSLLDTGDGYRLEKFWEYIISRPDPNVIWKKALDKSHWENVDAVFLKNQEGKWSWQIKTHLPERRQMTYKNLKFRAKLTSFRHTGVFPEQHLNWDWLTEKIATWKQITPSSFVKGGNRPRVLNLFWYTGIASVACSKAWADVTHVDASYPSITWTKDNEALTWCEKFIRTLPDDVMKFVDKEIRRWVKYDWIIMDPPVYWHWVKWEIWRFEDDFPILLQKIKLTLTDKPLFILINAYATTISSFTLNNIMSEITKDLGWKSESWELVLEENSTKRLLSTGIYARWSA